MRKWIVVVSVVVVVIAAATWFFVFRKSGQHAVTHAVPADAAWAVETPSFNSIHENLRRNKIWGSLMSYPAFEEYHGNLEYADSVCNAYPVLKRMIADRPFAISCHMVAPAKYDFLYVCDLGKLNVIKAFEVALEPMLKGYQVKIVRHGEIQEVVLPEMKLYYTIKANLLIVSLSETLVEKAVKACGQAQTPGRKSVAGDLTVEVNHKQLDVWMKALFPGSQDDGEPGSFDRTLLELELKDKFLAFEGKTSLDSSRFSLLNALNLLDGGAANVKKVAGRDVAACMSFCFPSFPELEAILLENYKTNDLPKYREYEQNLARINKYLGVDVLELFTSWIGGEIAVIKPAVDKERRLDNMVVAIRSKDIDLAKDQLGYLTEQIGRKTPVRFKSIEYNGHSIHYLSMKGFFGLFFGSFFNKLDRPYYTFIEDYVIFSNSSATLASMIKDYSLGNTLERDEKYNALMSGLGGGRNVYGYVNASNMYDYLYESVKPESKAEFAKNKGAFLSFEALGFTLANAGSGFETRIVANHNVDAPEEYAVKELSRQLEGLADEIESGYYFPAVPDSIVVSTKGSYSYQTELLAFSGNLGDGEPEGVWRVADRKGAEVAQLVYKRGVPEGEARFFYRDGVVHAQVSYEAGKIVGYKEFFQDGALKMEMEYRKGLRHGDIRFYYSTGHLRGEGKYKKGQRSGTWKYYRVTGEADYKMKF